ncbi:Protein AATF like [Actinidia chinensis var. chinensis]|uniref:Protein AATF like n=1 Tax=Actinidia chinensis var. chinensis TaxID=1590841 RepID=A0A2R6S102_ACTCC|nr:Protein AATF like [Actinidia chinensis var. chinensis]
MGKSSKKPRKEEESDSGSQDESETELENRYGEDGDEYSDDNEEEEDSEEDVDGGEQNDIRNDAEMEELEKELSDIRHQEQDLLRNLNHHKDEDLLKGQAVKNQKAIWDKTLELRFLLQKAFSSSNRLPKEPLKSSFCDSDSGVNDAYSDLITSSKRTLDSLLELQEALLEKNPSIAQASDGNSTQPLKHSEASSTSNGGGDQEWSQIWEIHSRIAPFRNKSIDKWQRKTQVTTGAAAIKGKLHAFNQNVSEQVAAYMRDSSRMIKGMQQNRSTVAIFGTVPDAEGKAKGQDIKEDGDPELLDDSEFYQQLLKEFFETFDPASSEAAFYALKRMQTKKRKIVDRRASKSRKIRYNVHEKIVNFMAPQPMQLPPMAAKLFEDLFGLKTQKPVPVE